MTVISIPTAHPARTRLRLTERGRRMLAFLAALPAAVALATREGGAPVGLFETVTVQSGDSLWSIATRIAPGADPRDVVDAIGRLNALDGGMITPGQELAIPAEYAP